MKNQIEIASDVNNSSSAGTLAHETRKSRRTFLCLFFCMISVVAMSLSSCSKDKDGDDGAGSNGILKITGIPTEYNNKYVSILGYTKQGGFTNDLTGYEKAVGDLIHFVKISGGEAKVPMWLASMSSSNPYTGNDKGVSIRVEVYEEANSGGFVWTVDPIRERRIAGVDFTNGNATVEWGAEPDFVGEWKKESPEAWIEFYEDGTWDISQMMICYRGTYTFSDKTAEMTITSATSVVSIVT